MRIYRLGDDGSAIVDIQQRLIDLGFPLPASESAGTFDEATDTAVRAFQGQRSLRVDGLIGPDTWGQLVEAGFRLGDRTLYVQSPYLRGDDVRSLQRKLDALGFDPGKQDGVYGPGTDAALREFQRNVGDDPDGVAGLHTIATLERMRPLEDVPGRGLIREVEELRSIRGQLQGQLIAIDPGSPTGDDTAAQPSLARSLASELARLGAKPELLRDPGEGLTASARAARANHLGATICVSLHVDEDASNNTGPTCSYYGSRATYSPAGMHLAELILDELEREVRHRGRLQRLTASMLRETRMPAVQVEAALLGTPTAATGGGRAIAEGVRRFFEG